MRLFLLCSVLLITIAYNKPVAEQQSDEEYQSSGNLDDYLEDQNQEQGQNKQYLPRLQTSVYQSEAAEDDNTEEAADNDQQADSDQGHYPQGWDFLSDDQLIQYLDALDQYANSEGQESPENVLKSLQFFQNAQFYQPEEYQQQSDQSNKDDQNQISDLQQDPNMSPIIKKKFKVSKTGSFFRKKKRVDNKRFSMYQETHAPIVGCFKGTNCRPDQICRYNICIKKIVNQKIDRILNQRRIALQNGQKQVFDRYKNKKLDKFDRFINKGYFNNKKRRSQMDEWNNQRGNQIYQNVQRTKKLKKKSNSWSQKIPSNNDNRNYNDLGNIVENENIQSNSRIRSLKSQTGSQNEIDNKKTEVAINTSSNTTNQSQDGSPTPSSTIPISQEVPSNVINTTQNPNPPNQEKKNLSLQPPLINENKNITVDIMANNTMILPKPN